jgi:hypothetical protein
MKLMRIKPVPPRLRVLTAGLALALAGAYTTQAHPYASDITVNNGTVKFYMNEAGATVTVTFDDKSTLNMGVLPKGATNFSLGSHTGYSIACVKIGTGSPSLLTTDSNFWNAWTSPRGVDVNKNAKNGSLFGRVYVGHTANTAVRQWGIYALTPDMSTNAFPLMGTNAWTATTKTSGLWQPDCAALNTSGPYRMTVAPDDSLYVTDFGTPGGTLWQFGPNFEYTNLVLNPIGENEGIAAGTHGDPIGVAIEGSISTGDLKIYTADPGLGAPAGIAGTANPGDYNDIFRYDIGAGPLPWNGAPNWAVNVGLPGFWDNQYLDMALGPDTTKVYGMFYRGNLSDGNVQVFDKASGARLYTSLNNGADIFASSYGGVRISPDGKYLATLKINNEIRLVNLVNGLPDETSLVIIPNTPTTGNARGLAWDAADNLYTISSGQALLRCYSLGITSTCVTSNDWTGTNGSFTLTMPDTTASVTAAVPLASQNYVNNASNPGTPIPGVFRITLNKSSLTLPTTVNFTRGGSATLGNQYTMNLGTTPNNIVIASNSVTFPAGNAPGGNWYADVQVIPTTNPYVGPTYTATLTLAGGGSYISTPPVTATIAIANTGPQTLTLSAISTASTMNRSIPGDYAEFTITRTGDTNGPSNSPGNVTPRSYTVTNFNYYGTAVYPADYTARAQLLNGGVPTDGMPGITINPGDVAITGIVGNPVAHTDLFAPRVNATIVINLTNTAAGSFATNCASSENLPYIIATAPVTLTEVDNRMGIEPNVLWSNPLTSAGDSVNWTVTYTDAGRATNPILPAVIRNYVNGASEVAYGGTNDFDVQFGYPVANDNVSPSAIMAANGWNTALRMTVNKNTFHQGAVNVYPQGKTFSGNYALRFQMYLSIYSGALNNPVTSTYPKEFALFGVNHYGTNCNWRPAASILPGAGCGPTNCDGVWFAIDADSGSTTPADFGAFLSPALPNAGTSDIVSNPGSTQTGVFKRPPFPMTHSAAGSPIDRWVDVSVEVTANTNVSLYIDGAKVLGSFGNTNGYNAGTIMLGYLDPVYDMADNTAFVYYSNVRVVELSPYIDKQPTPANVIVVQGSSVTFSNSASLGTAPLTNVWFTGATAPTGTALQIDTNNASTIYSQLVLTNLQKGTNYCTVVSDSSGSITSVVAVLEVIQGPTNASAGVGSTFAFRVTPVGQAAPTSYQWKLSSTNIANGSHFAGVTANVLWITNVQPADAGTYSVAVVNSAGTVTPSATLTVVGLPANIVVTPASQSALWGSAANFTVSADSTAPLTYTWKKNNVKLTNGGNVSGVATSTLTLSNLTTAEAATYTVGVTNLAGGGVGTGLLSVVVPQPNFSMPALSAGTVTLSFGSTNSYDTTNAFILQCSPNVQGPYTNTTGTFSTSGNGAFQVILPQTSDPSMFYRLQHAN